MASIEIVLSVISVVLTLLQLPAWNAFIKMRISMNTLKEVKEKADKLEDTMRKENEGLKKDIANVREAQHRSELEFAEILGKLNVSITQLNGTCTNLNKTLERSENQFKSMVNKVYEDFREHKENVNRLIEALQK